MSKQPETLSGKAKRQLRVQQGKLGYGGKYWRRENRVSCYREDETTERLRLIIELDAALAKLSNVKALPRGGAQETHE